MSIFCSCQVKTCLRSTSQRPNQSINQQPKNLRPSCGDVDHIGLVFRHQELSLDEGGEADQEDDADDAERDLADVDSLQQTFLQVRMILL